MGYGKFRISHELLKDFLHIPVDHVIVSIHTLDYDRTSEIIMEAPGLPEVDLKSQIADGEWVVETKQPEGKWKPKEAPNGGGSQTKPTSKKEG